MQLSICHEGFSPCYGTEFCLHKNELEFTLLKNIKHSNNLSSDHIYTYIDESSLEEDQILRKLDLKYILYISN